MNIPFRDVASRPSDGLRSDRMGGDIAWTGAWGTGALAGSARVAADLGLRSVQAGGNQVSGLRWFLREGDAPSTVTPVLEQ